VIMAMAHEATATTVQIRKERCEKSQSIAGSYSGTCTVVSHTTLFSARLSVNEAGPNLLKVAR
jgi:hypothetical protein